MYFIRVHSAGCQISSPVAFLSANTDASSQPPMSQLREVKRDGSGLRRIPGLAAFVHLAAFLLEKKKSFFLTLFSIVIVTYCDHDTKEVSKVALIQFFPKANGTIYIGTHRHPSVKISFQ